MLGGLLLLATVSIFNTNETKAATAGSLVNGGYQTAHYGYGGYGRYNPHTFHTGMDVAARYGSAIKSQAAGRVIYSG